MTGALASTVGTMTSSVANGAAAVGFNRNTTNAFSTAGAVLDRVQNNGVTKWSIDKDGKATAADQIISNINGSESAPYIKGNAGRGWYEGVGGLVYTDGTAHFRMSASAVQITRAAILGWSDTVGSIQSSQAINLGVAWSASGIVEVNNGTAGTFRDLKVRNLLAGGGNGSYVQTPSMTVANLAAAATAGAGARAFVTDATATTFLSTVAGGGANKVPVVSDGANWLIG